MKKVIYVYKQLNSLDNTYKIGKADQRADQSDDISIEDIARVRIREQLTAATYGEIQIVNTYDISHVDSSLVVEGAIHDSLKIMGYTMQSRVVEGRQGNTEWFDFENLTEGEVLEIVGQLVEESTGFTGLKEFTPRGYQSHIKNQIVDIISNGGKVVGAELAPRFGKTLWTLDTFEELSKEQGFQYLLLPAYVLTAHASFQKELRSFSNFSNISFVSDKDDNFETVVRNAGNSKLVIAISLHTPEESLGKYTVIRELDPKKKISFIDEADFGAHTKSSKHRIDILDTPTKVIMTGTAIERALVGYDIDSVVKWSYFDMLLLKDGDHPMLKSMSEEDKELAINSCAPVVRPKLFKMSMPNASIIQEGLPGVLQTSWSKMLSNVNTSRYILEGIIRAMFKNDNSGITEMSGLTLSSVTPADVSMIFGSFRNKTQHDMFVRLVSSCLGENFTVLKINGDETTNSQAEFDVKQAVAKAQRAGKRVVIISKDMASRSFSVPEIDTVFLMYDNGLLSQTVQKSSRVFTPGKAYDGETKLEGTIVSLSLDSNREDVDPIDLYILAEAQRITEEGDSLQDNINRICNSVNIFQNDLVYGYIPLNSDEYASEMLKRSSVLKQALASIALDRIDLGKYDDAVIYSREVSMSMERDSEVDISGVISSVRDSKKESEDKESNKEYKQLIKNILFFISNATALLEIDNYRSNTVRGALYNIENDMNIHEITNFYGLSPLFLIRLIDDKVIPEGLINTLLKAHEPQVLEFN